MKQIIFIVLLWMSCTFIFAQDIIVTKQSEKIEAKITDVEQDCIKYKKFNYQEGPTYTIKKSEIASIIYQNGDVETFFESSTQPQSNNESSSSNSYKREDFFSSLKAKYKSNAGQYQFVEGYCTHVSIRSKSLFGGNTIKYSGYVIGENVDGMSDFEIENKIRSGELAFFEDLEFKEYLKKYDTETYHKFKQGLDCNVSAYVLTSVACVGVIVMIALLYADASSMAVVCTSIPTLVLGGISVPLWISGSKICHSKVPEMYNNRNANRQHTSSISWNVGLVGNGVGLQLKF